MIGLPRKIPSNPVKRRSSSRTTNSIAAYFAAMQRSHGSSAWIAALLASDHRAGVMAAPIDRHALVTRHNPTITAVDKSAPFMVGNGNFAFTADITGLQTFQDQYSPLVPLMTQAQWGWHSFPNPQGLQARAGA